WNYATWQVTSASNGALGAGLGVPRVPWAPDFGGIVQDTLPPASTAALSGSSGAGNWFLSSVGVTVSATDSQSGVATIQARTDGGAWQLYISPVTVAGDGTHTLDYYATDVAGNVESTHSVSVKIDTVSPASLSQIAGTPTASGASGVAISVAYRLDGGSWSTYGGTFTVREGRHTLDYQASDADGYVEALRTLAVNVDTTPPAIVKGADVLAPNTPLAW